MRTIKAGVIALLVSLGLIGSASIAPPTASGTSGALPMAQPTPTPEEKYVSAWSDGDGNPFSSKFTIPAGFVGTNVNLHVDTSWMTIGGFGHTDQVGCSLTGPVAWTSGITWEGGSYGPPAPVTLPAGSYELTMEWHGKHDTCRLYYDLVTETTATPDPNLAEGKKCVSAWSDENGDTFSTPFAIPAGWVGTDVHLQINTEFLPLGGVGHTDRVGCSLTGPVAWTRGLTWERDSYGPDAPKTLLAGAYQFSMEWHGKLDRCELCYDLQPAASLPTGETCVVARSDADGNPVSMAFAIPAGWVGTDVHLRIDTDFMTIGGVGHTDRVGCSLTGPVAWTRGLTWARDSYGPDAPKALPAGAYQFSMEWHGKLDRCELCYTLKPGAGAGAGIAVTPTVIDVGGPGGPGSLDLIFCIDVTSSMSDDIDQVKAAAASIIDTAASENEDYRVAIIAFRDWDDDPVFEDYPFSTDRATIVESINSLTVYGGGDIPEAVYEALMRAIDSTSVGGWRTDVNKQVILMGDAPPHSPGRNGETAPAVAKAAEEADPVVIQAVAVALGGEFDTEMVTAFRELADLTGGNYFEAADASEVPAVLQETIRESVKAPTRMPALPIILLAGGGIVALGAAGALILVLSTGKAASGASSVAATAAPPWSPQPPQEPFRTRPVRRPEGAPEQSSPKKPSGPPETL